MPVVVAGKIVAASCRVLLHLRKNPWIGRRGTPDHHRVATSLFRDACGVFGRVDIAIPDDRNFDRLLDARDQVPIGAATVALSPRAWMDGYTLHPDGLRHFGHIHGHNGIFVPAGAQLDGQWNADSGPHRTKNFTEKLQIAQQTRAAALHDFFRRAPEVNVHRVVSQVFNHFCGVRHDFRIRPKKLRGDGMLIFLKI